MKKSINLFLVLLLIFSSVPNIALAVEKEEEKELIEEYKLYSEKEDEDILIYANEKLEEEMYELKDDISVLVNQTELETSLEEELDYVYITLNPEVEEVPVELREEIENTEDIQGFVHIDRLVSLEDEDEFILERKTKNEFSEEETTNDPEEAEETETEEIDENESDTSEESEIIVEEEPGKEKAEVESKETEEKLTDESQEKPKKETEEITKEKNTFSMMRSSGQETSTSRLGHIRGGDRLIYGKVGGKSIKVADKHLNTVYYIKRQSKVGSEMYYLLSNSPSATKGVVGWMKAKDVSTHTHIGVTKASKQLMIKGTGKATSRAWGGNKDTIHKSMSSFKGDTLDVNLTEKVGNNIWYRGKINGEGANVWVHSSQTEAKPDITESNTSLLGHIRGGNRLIYETIGGKSIKVSSKHQNTVYYIKREAKLGSQVYYLLSTSPSATRGVFGWMKAKDVSTHTHMGVTKASNQFKIKGTGKATSKAWGGSKDAIHSSMKSFKGDFFNVNLTEKVGNNIWYRGKINGQGANVWLHSSQTEKFEIKESDTSRLGHIRGGNRLIYKTIGGNSVEVSATHQNKVYYIKREAEVDSETYYLLSNSPSARKGVVGWMKSTDVSTHTHVGVSKKTRQLLVKGTGKGTSRAWGGSKNTVHSSMKSFEGEFFNVNLTEKVGNNTWYRGKINDIGVNVWLHSSQTQTTNVTETDFGLTLDEAVKIQYEKRPVILSGGITRVAKANEIKERLDPKCSINHPVNNFQFLDLRKRTGLSAKEMNRELATRGILSGKGNSFRDASIDHGVNEMYLIVHARLETGNGTSPLSNGSLEVGVAKDGSLESVTPSNRLTLKKIKKTYNMFGIGAVDGDAERAGAIRAYEEGWFSPEAAIVGGAHWIKDNYIYNKFGQNTLYKMRWNPKMVDGFAWKQYATDIDWATKQAKLIDGIYNHTDKNKILSFDIPIYK